MKTLPGFAKKSVAAIVLHIQIFCVCSIYAHAAYFLVSPIPLLILEVCVKMRTTANLMQLFSSTNCCEIFGAFLYKQDPPLGHRPGSSNPQPGGWLHTPHDLQSPTMGWSQKQVPKTPVSINSFKHMGWSVGG